MLLARKRVTTRFAATALAAGLVAAGAMGTAAPAAAEETPGAQGVTATLDGLAVYDLIDVTANGQEAATYNGGLFNLAADDGGTLQTYCIDFNTAAQNGTQYKETDWDSTSLHDNPDAGKINWILQNSYPTVDDLNALADEAGVDSLTKEQAAAGTQAAIWEYSDGVDAVPQNKNAAGLAEWLYESAENVEEPGPSLQLSPTEISGKPGEVVGPITVSTSTDAVYVSLDESAIDQGVTIVDANGQEITEQDPVTDGTQLYVSVPEGADDGSATLTATATSSVPVGRAFTGVDTVTQTMILAGSSDSSVTASVTASWASEGPSPAVTANENCAKGGVDVTATNEGDESFVFELSGEEYEVAPGESQTVTFPVEDGQAYDITITGLEEGQEWNFTGVLDCATSGDGGMEEVDDSSSGSGGSDDSSSGTDSGDSGTDLAETGGSGSPAMIAGFAVLLLVAGGATLFFMRRRSASASVTGGGSDE